MIMPGSAVERVGFRLESSLSALLNSFHYSHETHPAGSDTHGCLTLHFAKNGNERRAKSLKPTLPTAVFRIIGLKILADDMRPEFKLRRTL
jgi:hypothetical protein